MKKILKIQILIVFVLFVTCSNVFAATTVTSYKPNYGTLTENVNFRSVASTSSGKIRTLSKGTSIKMVGTVGNFYIVQLGSNEIGVVSKDYVKSASSAPSGASTYTSIGVKNMQTNTDSVTLRRGPSTSFSKITSLAKNTAVRAVGYIGDWYIVVTDSNQVGCIRNDLLKTASSSNTNTTTSNFSMSENGKIIFNLINEARTKAGVPKLTTDSTLFKIARLKAQDMVKNSYFSHTSPTYGGPFEMMKKYGITYKSAGENIAGNPSLEAAVNAWLNSETHKQNLLSNSYNYIGIGVEKSNTYGYIIDVMFIRKIAKDNPFAISIYIS